jgi:protoporphyrin/coproporphyrin ferrochelatase
MKEWAVLLMAYGGPDSLDDVEPYLLDIRGGRQTPVELVEEIRGRYERIGGKSPLLEITQAQAKALEERLNRNIDGGDRFRFTPACVIGLRRSRRLSIRSMRTGCEKG